MASNRIIIFLLLAGLFQGCKSEESTLKPEPYRTRARGISWARCPPGPYGEDVECALFEVPADWSAAFSSNNKSVILLRRLKRPLAESSPSKGQFWALDGGPGMAGDSFFEPEFVRFVHQSGYDLYVPSHRGSGYANPLSCQEFEHPDSDEGIKISVKELPDCLSSAGISDHQLTNWGPKDAAKDLLYLRRRTQASNQKNKTKATLFGGSYGTLWGQWVLRQQDKDFDLAIFDSIVPIGVSLNKIDHHAQIAGEAVLSRCDKDPLCSEFFLSTLNSTALETANEVRKEMATGQWCGAKLDPIYPIEEVQALLYSWISGHPDDRSLIPSWVFRMKRCSEADQAALNSARQAFRKKTSAGKNGSHTKIAYSQLLNKIVIASDLYVPNTTLQDAPEPPLLFSSNSENSLAKQYRVLFPNGQRGRDSEFPTIGIPVLLTHGGLDPLDPPAWAVQANSWWGDKSHLVLFKDSGHSTVRYTRSPEKDGEKNCTLALWSQALDGKLLSQDFDQSCVDQQRSIDFHPDALERQALHWYGVSEAYGN